MTEDDVHSPDEWLNLNSFAARLYASGLTGWGYAIWELRDAFEKELGPSPDDNDCQIAAASEWLIQGAPQLLRVSLEVHVLDEADKRAYSGSPLWAGAPGLGAERWGFWKRRLGEVRESVKTQLTLDYLEQAEKAMVKAETDLIS